MNNLVRMKKQTEDLSDTVLQIRSLFNQKTLPLHAAEMHNLLVDLKNKVHNHFKEEKAELIPELLSHGDKAIKDITNQYSLEMNNISSHLDTYLNRWGDTSSIRENPAGCINDTKSVCGELTKSITIEKRKLYPFFDKKTSKRRGN